MRNKFSYEGRGMSSLAFGIVLFVAFTIGLFIAGFVIYATMNLVRLVLSAMFRSRRLSHPYPGAQGGTASDVFETGAIQFLPPWLPAPVRLIWCASGFVTLTIRYALRVWWPILLGAALLTWWWLSSS